MTRPSRANPRFKSQKQLSNAHERNLATPSGSLGSRHRPPDHNHSRRDSNRTPRTYGQPASSAEDLTRKRPGNLSRSSSPPSKRHQSQDHGYAGPALQNSIGSAASNNNAASKHGRTEEVRPVAEYTTKPRQTQGCGDDTLEKHDSSVNSAGPTHLNTPAGGEAARRSESTSDVSSRTIKPPKSIHRYFSISEVDQTTQEEPAVPATLSSLKAYEDQMRKDRKLRQSSRGTSQALIDSDPAIGYHNSNNQVAQSIMHSDWLKAKDDIKNLCAEIEELKVLRTKLSDEVKDLQKVKDRGEEWKKQFKEQVEAAVRSQVQTLVQEQLQETNERTIKQITAIDNRMTETMDSFDTFRRESEENSSNAQQNMVHRLSQIENSHDIAQQATSTRIGALETQATQLQLAKEKLAALAQGIDHLNTAKDANLKSVTTLETKLRSIQDAKPKERMDELQSSYNELVNRLKIVCEDIQAHKTMLAEGDSTTALQSSVKDNTSNIEMLHQGLQQIEAEHVAQKQQWDFTKNTLIDNMERLRKEFKAAKAANETPGTNGSVTSAAAARLSDDVNAIQTRVDSEIQRLQAQVNELKTLESENSTGIRKTADAVEKGAMAIRHLETRYDNLSTDSVYQQVVHWFNATYPDQPSIHKKLDHIQKNTLQVQDHIDQVQRNVDQVQEGQDANFQTHRGELEALRRQIERRDSSRDDSEKSKEQDEGMRTIRAELEKIQPLSQDWMGLKERIQKLADNVTALQQDASGSRQGTGSDYVLHTELVELQQNLESQISRERSDRIGGDGAAMGDLKRIEALVEKAKEDAQKDRIRPNDLDKLDKLAALLPVLEDIHHTIDRFPDVEAAQGKMEYYINEMNENNRDNPIPNLNFDYEDD